MVRGLAVRRFRGRTRKPCSEYEPAYAANESELIRSKRIVFTYFVVEKIEVNGNGKRRKKDFSLRRGALLNFRDFTLVGLTCLVNDRTSMNFGGAQVGLGYRT